MTSDRQLSANRLNAQRSTGPRTVQGKSRSRRNALKHGLTARTIIVGIENPDEFLAFSRQIASAYRTTSPVQRQMVERLATLLWRLRRAQMFETGLLNIQAKQQRRFKQKTVAPVSRTVIPLRQSHPTPDVPCAMPDQDDVKAIAITFLRLSNLNGDTVDRLTRYETALWRQCMQLIILLDRLAVTRAP